MEKPSLRKASVGHTDPGKVSARNHDRDRLLAQCRIDTFRAGGKGGQHQNKVESGVRLTHKPTGVVVTSRKFRSQRQNREEAVRRLMRKLDARRRTPRPRIPTGIPPHEKQKRLEAKKRRSRLKGLRRTPTQDI